MSSLTEDHGVQLDKATYAKDVHDAASAVDAMTQMMPSTRELLRTAQSAGTGARVADDGDGAGVDTEGDTDGVDAGDAVMAAPQRSHWHQHVAEVYPPRRPRDPGWARTTCADDCVNAMQCTT
jgi:hypothetical protein